MSLVSTTLPKDSKIILFGAGAAGKYAVRYLREQGIEPLLFADNDHSRWSTTFQDIEIQSPASCQTLWPNATWVACAVSRPAAQQLRTQISSIGVMHIPLWKCFPVPHGSPTQMQSISMKRLVDEVASRYMLIDQLRFRRELNYDEQINPLPSIDTYFPDFFTRLPDEHFVDCGAAEGTTVGEFIKRWPSYARITAIEPDPVNFDKLLGLAETTRHVYPRQRAVTDFTGTIGFEATGDWTAHINAKHGSTNVDCCKLDDYFWSVPPTFIKMDVEGSELEALWGARQLLQEYKPVLAICGYHTSEHLWQVPLLIHALQPEYKLFFRRYAEGAFELVWYGVPPERLNK